MQYFYKWQEEGEGRMFLYCHFCLSGQLSLPQQKHKHQPTAPDPAFPGEIAICHQLQQQRDSSHNKSHQFTRQLSMGATLWLWLQMKPIQACWQPGTHNRGGWIQAKSLLFLQETYQARSTHRSGTGLPGLLLLPQRYFCHILVIKHISLIMR